MMKSNKAVPASDVTVVTMLRVLRLRKAVVEEAVVIVACLLRRGTYLKPIYSLCQSE